MAAVAEGQAVPSELERIQDQVAARLPNATPLEVQFATLLQWEKTLDKGTEFPRAGGRLTAYFTALRGCLGSSTGPLSAALGQALDRINPEAMFSDPGNGYTYLTELPNRTVMEVTGKVGGVEQLSGVACAGLWNEGEQKNLGAALEKLARVYPRCGEKLKSIVVQTWIGDKDPSKGYDDVGGNVDSQSPGFFRLSRNGVRSSELQHYLFHEFAHLVDNQAPGASGEFDFASHQNQAFVGHSKPLECVSKYAQTAVHEDYAETFAFCVEHQDKILAHPDLYFYALGGLSSKFRNIFEKSFGMEIPAPGVRMAEFQEALLQGRTPFGLLVDEGKTVGAPKHSHWALRELAVASKLENLQERIERENNPVLKEQLQFAKSFFVDGESSLAQPQSVEEVQAKLLEFGQLQPRLAANSQQLEENTKGCQGYSDPSQVPSDRTGYTGLLWGQAAMQLSEKLEATSGREPQVWKSIIESGLKDPVLLEQLQKCPDFASIKDLTAQRQQQLMDFYSQLSARQKAENVPQQRDALYEERHTFSGRHDRLKSELGLLVGSLQSGLGKRLTDADARETYYSILHSTS